MPLRTSIWRTATRRSALLLVTIAALALAAPRAPKAPLPIYVDGHGIAISGYDVVSYFEAGEPQKGKAGLKAEFRGATFLFSSADNRDRFLAAPEQFVPQFGGYCAFAMGKGQVRKCDPKRFSLKDGKLYLFSGGAAKQEWEKDENGLLSRAIEFWRGLFPG